MSSRTGNLRHRIEIQQPVNTEDGQGGFVTTWTVFKTVWAEILPTSSNERLFAEKVEEMRTHKITIRYLEGISANMRIVYQGRIFQIKGIRREKEQKFWHLIDARENEGT